MAKRSSSPVEQQLAQLEYLENDQLKELLVELESKKRQLPVEDHAIIDWGINTLKAKISEKKVSMSERQEEIDGRWDVFLGTTHQSFINKYSSGANKRGINLSLGNLDLRNDDDERRLYAACFYESWDILELMTQGYRPYQLAGAVNVFGNNLRIILTEQRCSDLYAHYISQLIPDIANNIANKIYDNYDRAKYDKHSRALFQLLES